MQLPRIPRPQIHLPRIAVGQIVYRALSPYRAAQRLLYSGYSWIGRTLYSMKMGLLHGLQAIWHGICTAWREVAATPGRVIRSPLKAYRGILSVRNWMLAKVEYLQSESTKWKTTFNILKAPYSLLRSLGFSPQMATTFLMAGSVVGSGVVVNETILSERSFSRGDSGVFSAPSDIPISYVEGDNTLRIVLGSTPVREITIENVSVGTVFTGSSIPTGETTAVLIGGTEITEGTDTVLEIGELIIEKSRCKSMDFTNIDAHTINVIGQASDGQSINVTPGTARMRAIGGGHHQAEAMVTSGGTYDRIHIDAPTSAVNGQIGTLKLSNVFSKGGACTFERMEVGTLTIQLNTVGHDSDFSTKEFSIASSVTGANWNVVDNVEINVTEPATQ